MRQSWPPLGGRVYPHLVGVLTEKVSLNVGLYGALWGFNVPNAPQLTGVVSSDRCINVCMLMYINVF